MMDVVYDIVFLDSVSCDVSKLINDPPLHTTG